MSETTCYMRRKIVLRDIMLYYVLNFLQYWNNRMIPKLSRVLLRHYQ